MSENIKYSDYRKPPDDWSDLAVQAWHEAHEIANRQRMEANEDYRRDLYERDRAHKERLARIEENLRSAINRIEKLANDAQDGTR